MMNDERSASAARIVSVILCTHNPRLDYLKRTLSGLAAQTLDRSRWELILVDNASSPPVADRVDLTSFPSAKVVVEQTLGLTPARLRGIRESTGDLLVFVDDDNVLDPDFLEASITVADNKPFLGSWSGQCRPQFEESPPDWTRRYWGNLVIREFDEDVWSNQPRLTSTMPCGAGLCVRRQVALHYLELHQSGQREFQLDRTGTSLASGGDNDLAACACDLGLGLGLVASLKLTHLIPPERLTEDYLSRLAEGIYTSSAMLDHARGIPVRRRSVPRRIRDLINELRAGSPHRRILRAAHRGYDRAVQTLDRAT